MNYQAVSQDPAVKEWLLFKKNKVQESTFEPTIGARLGRELMGLTQLLRMHELGFDYMEWWFEQCRLVLLCHQDDLMVIRIDADCGLNARDFYTKT